jgi:hypothetical protein
MCNNIHSISFLDPFSGMDSLYIFATAAGGGGRVVCNCPRVSVARPRVFATRPEIVAYGAKKFFHSKC